MKREKILVIVLVVAIVATAFIWFTNRSRDASVDLTASRDRAGLELETLDDPRLDDLVEFGQFPIKVGPTGKSNPFKK